MKNLLKKILIYTIIFIVLYLLPLIIIAILYKNEVLIKANNGEIVSGVLTYYGTLILGSIAIMQTQISLKQNSETFKADKYSAIKILKDCSFEIIDNNTITNYNQNHYPVNQYYVKRNNNFEFDEKLKCLNVRLFYTTLNYLIKKITLKKVKGNYTDHYFINSDYITDLCECPSSGCGQLEVVFMLYPHELNVLNDLFNDGQLIFVFTFEIISCFDVVMTETIEVNFSPLNNGQKKKCFTSKKLNWTVFTTSYTYNKGENYERRKFKNKSESK